MHVTHIKQFYFISLASFYCPVQTSASHEWSARRQVFLRGQGHPGVIFIILHRSLCLVWREYRPKHQLYCWLALHKQYRYIVCTVYLHVIVYMLIDKYRCTGNRQWRITVFPLVGDILVTNWGYFGRLCLNSFFFLY